MEFVGTTSASKAYCRYSPCRIVKEQLADQVTASQSLKRGHPTREGYRFRTIAQFAVVAVCRVTSHTWNMMISVVEVVGVIVVALVWVVVLVVFVTGVLIDDVVVVVAAIVDVFEFIEQYL